MKIYSLNNTYNLFRTKFDSVCYNLLIYYIIQYQSNKLHETL